MKKALILIDIQNDYFENGRNPLSGANKACENAKLILYKFRKENLPIIHIQHISTRPTATFFIPQTEGAEIHPMLKPLNNELVVVKHFPNSFRETDLLLYLQSHNITDLTICGMMTHMCVDATVRAAKDYGFDVCLIADACATKDLEINGVEVKASEVQNSFIAALSYFYATITTTFRYLEQ